MIVMA